MTGTKTVAQRLMEKPKSRSLECWLAKDVVGLSCDYCGDCYNKTAKALADMIEAEKVKAVSKALIEEIAKPENIGIGLLRDVAKDLEEYAQMVEGAPSEDLAYFAGLIRKALRGAKPQLPEGVIWPTYEDGELVKFGDKIQHDGEAKKVSKISFYRNRTWIRVATETCYEDCEYLPNEPVKRPDPEVLDADGVPIKVGDTVYAHNAEPLIVRGQTSEYLTLIEDSNGDLWEIRSDALTHRKPDTLGDIKDEATLPPREYCNRHQLLGADSAYFDEAEVTTAMCWHLIDRTRKLLGGE